MVKKYSQFINFPIYIYSSKKITKEVEDDTPVENTEESKEDINKTKDEN